jgi:hypothetical protein
MELLRYLMAWCAAWSAGWLLLLLPVPALLMVPVVFVVMLFVPGRW